jgi:hypothetical protein
MKTFFWLFGRYREAKSAVGTLLAAGVDAGEMNALVTVKTAKEVMDVNWEKADVQVTDEIGDQELTGLDGLLAREHPVTTPDVGDVYAAGKVATIVGKTASSAMREPHGLAGALEDINVPHATAQAFAEGLSRGGVLIWARVDGEQAPEVTGALQDRRSDVLASHTSG